MSASATIQLQFARVWRNLTWPYPGAREIDRDYCVWADRRDMLATLLERVVRLSNEQWTARPLYADRLEYRQHLQEHLTWVEKVVDSALTDVAHMSRLRLFLVQHLSRDWDAERVSLHVIGAAMLLAHRHGGNPEDRSELAAGLRYAAGGFRGMADDLWDSDREKATECFGLAIDARAFADLLILGFDDSAYARFNVATDRYETEQAA